MRRSARSVGTIAALITLALASPACEPADEASSAPSPTVDHQVHDPIFPHVGRLDLDVSHYDLDLRWDSGTRTLSGLATIDVTARFNTEPLSLDFLHALKIAALTMDGNEVSFEHRGNKLFIGHHDLVAGQQHTVLISYEGRPHPVPFPGSRRDIPNLGWTNEPHGEAWTMQEPYGALTWYPVNDQPSDKATYDISLNVPASQVGIAGGDPIKMPTLHAHRMLSRFRLDEPTASYLTTLAIGRYQSLSPANRTDPDLTYWVPVGQNAARYLEILKHSPQILDLLVDDLGPLSFSHQGAVVVPSRSAMETQELITLGPGWLKNKREALAVLNHEYAHQWYGDMVTPRTWDDLWMNEGFAMYIELDYRVGSDPDAMDGIHDWLARRDQKLRDKFGPPGDFKEGEWGSTNVYYCGALMLFELRERVGQETFDALLRDWPQDHNGQTVTRDEYIDWVSLRVGSDMRPFFEEWLTSKTTPEGAGVGD